VLNKAGYTLLHLLIIIALQTKTTGILADVEVWSQNIGTTRQLTELNKRQPAAWVGSPLRLVPGGYI